MNILIPFIQQANKTQSPLNLDWELLIRQARKSLLLSHVAILVKHLDLNKEAHSHFFDQLCAAEVLTTKQKQVVKWELQQISNALKHLDVPVIVLKGGAYIAQNLQAGQGRLLSDVDIMVPRSSIRCVESALKKAGYFGKKLSAYDEKYYRKWMHEIPPLVHFNRQTTLDVHHSILPLTVKLKPDPIKLLRNAQPIDDFHEMYTLSETDMFLHSCAHLFHDGELEHGLRDLIDMNALLSEFTQRNTRYWDDLCDRAWELNLEQPLYYAMRYCSKILDTTVPDHAWIKMNKAAMTPWRRKILDSLFVRAFQPDHSTCDDTFTSLARWILYIRSHYLRMPLYLLLPHLFRKAFIAPYEERKREVNKRKRQNMP